MTSSKYDSLIKGLTGLNIALVDVNGEYRSTYDILADIASKWDSLSSMEQAALADAIAGTRQQAAFFSIVEQFQEASGSMEAMANSAGVLDDAYATYLDSTTAHINQFKAAFQEMSSNLFSSDFLSLIVDMGRGFVEFSNAVIKAKLGLVALGSALAITKYVQYRKALIASAAQLKSLTAQLVTEKKVTGDLAVSIAALNREQLQKLKTDLAAKVSSGQLSAAEEKQILDNIALITSEEALEVENGKLAASFNAVTASIPGWGIFLIALAGVITAIGASSKAAKEMKEQFSNNTTALSEQVSVLEDYKEKIDEIANSEENLSDKISKLNAINQNLSDGYDIRVQSLKDETKYIDELNKKIDEEILKKKKLYLLDNESSYVKGYYNLEDFKANEDNIFVESFKKLIDRGYESDVRKLKKQTLDGYIGFDTKNISDSILNLFEYDSESNSISIGTKVQNEAELLTVMRDAYIKFGDIINLRKMAGNDLTEDEQALYESLQRNYENLTEHLGESGINYENLVSLAKTKAEVLMTEIGRGSRSLEAWEYILVKSAGNDKLVIDQIHQMIDAMRELNDVVETDPFDALLQSLKDIEAQLESFKENISSVSDYFDDMVKVIDKNKEVDKFFTADEMIDLLDKYPELNNAVLVTTYGYKLEEKALEELRETKLAEQKDDLYTKLQETQTALLAAEKKVNAYGDELEEIHNLADAEALLIEIESQLAAINPASGKAKELEEKRSKVSNYIDAKKSAEDLREEYEKDVMQYTILGTVFDDLADSTNDTTKAMNAQKSAKKDLSDEYKDAKDSIEDLIKLTMDMLKKNANLRKDALKEQLDGFKKLISKRKELIDLEKEQYSFEKNLKEQNKDLLKIQQEFDALSVEGVNYSLEDIKRRNELEQQLAEQTEKRDEFLYDHEVDVRKEALDKEEELFEDKINTQIKAIEDYLAHEGKIRQEAVDLINGQSQQFYNDLLDYTMNYTDKSRYEFQKLWDDAYEALRKYGNGVIDVDATLAFLIGSIKSLEDQMNDLDDKINNLKETATQFTNGFSAGVDGVEKQFKELISTLDEAEQAMNAVSNKTSGHSYWYTPDLGTSSNKSSNAIGNARGILNNLVRYNNGEITRDDIFKFHDGGLVPHQGITKNAEVFAKLLAGEVVVTQDQASNFFKNTLPKLANASNSTINSSPTITIGDINISGNADASTVAQLKQVQQEIVNDVFNTINNQKNIYSGSRIR